MAQHRASTRVRPARIPYEPARVTPYATMIEEFLNGTLPADAFEARYLRMYKDDPTRWPESIYEPLNEVFLDLDAYCPDPELRDDDPLAIDEAELRRRVAVAQEALRRIA